MAGKSKKGTAVLIKVITYTILIILAISIIVPVSWVFLASLKENSEFTGNPWSLPKGLYLENYVKAWKDAKMGEYMLNSVITTTTALAILLVISLPAAYVLSRYNFKSRKLLNTLFMGGLFINVNYIVVPIFLMFVDADKKLMSAFGGNGFFQNNIFMLALVYAATALPFTIYLLSGYFASLPKDFEEAAYVDGAGYFTTMIKVIFPMARPSIITVILFNFLSFWNEYIIALTLLSNPTSAKTLPVGLMNLTTAQNAAAEYGKLYAGLVLVLLPTLILYMLVQRRLTQGMMVGGLKG